LEHAIHGSFSKHVFHFVPELPGCELRAADQVNKKHSPGAAILWDGCVSADASYHMEHAGAQVNPLGSISTCQRAV